MPLILGIISVVATGGWIWWETSSEDPEKPKSNPIVTIVLVLLVVLVFSLLKLGKAISK